MLAHIRSHILHNPSINLSQEPCGLCLCPAVLCSIYLTRHMGWTGHWTLKYGGSIPCPNTTMFSYAAAMSSSKTSPCSNVPLACPYCLEGSPAVWCYNLHHHLCHHHHSINPTKHINLWKLTPEETEAMVVIWKTCHKQPKCCSRGTQKLPLKVSEAHSSCNLLRYVNYVIIIRLYHNEL